MNNQTNLVKKITMHFDAMEKLEEFIKKLDVAGVKYISAGLTVCVAEVDKVLAIEFLNTLKTN